MRRPTIALFSLLLAAPLLSDGLSPKYRNWDKSPDAYFLTAREAADWKQVKDDAAAQMFIADYFARRGPALRKTLDERIAVADKYFSAGSVKGSATLRGKVIIVFGPPSELKQSEGESAMGRAPSPDRAEVASGVADPHSNVGPGVAGLHHSEKDPIFSILYDAAHAPKAIDSAFRVDLKMKSASRQEAVDPKDLEEKFEAVARASLLLPVPLSHFRPQAFAPRTAAENFQNGGLALGP